MTLTERFSNILKKLDDVLFKVSGFRYKDIDFDVIVERLYTPTDPSSLGVSRMLFGLLMMVDGAEERGGAELDLRWGDPNFCHFPLLPLSVLPLQYMAIIYGVMWFGALGIALGYKFRTSALMFVIPYWYILLMDKSYWNNHSYLFGLLGILLIGTQANNYLSLDALYDSSKRGKAIPYWNYFIIKYQLFILYFIAGLKKSGVEWLSGYAMSSLSQHWVFDPFKLFLSTEYIDYLIVHWFAFLFDLTVCFWMVYSPTRAVAMLFCASFHLMNSRLFSIGMFPWVCLATMPMFCPPNWPKIIINAILETLSHCKQLFKKRISSPKLLLFDLQPKPRLDLPGDSNDGENDSKQQDEKNDDLCKSNNETDGEQTVESVDSDKKDAVKPENENSVDSKDVLKQNDDNPDESSAVKNDGRLPKKLLKKKIVVSLLMAYMGVQAFLPYSHFITKGYNNWTNGLYGYSWDMMVHNWDSILVLVKIVDNESNFEMFLDPEAWTPNLRWSKHGDMTYQYARCLQRNLINSIDQKAIAKKNIPVSNKYKGRHEHTCDPEKKSCKYFEEENEEIRDQITSKNISIYIDVWCSLNGRFQQRMFNPNVDLLNVTWSPFKNVDWLMPLLVELNNWRTAMADIQKHVYSWNNYSEVLFVADFPGLYLENYITPEISNISLTVLDGQVFYEPHINRHKSKSHYPGKSRAFHLTKGESVAVKAGVFHRVHTVGASPACYMYTYMNSTMKTVGRDAGDQDEKKAKPKLPLMKEFKRTLNNIVTFLEHVGNAVLNIMYDVPMVRRIPLR